MSRSFTLSPWLVLLATAFVFTSHIQLASAADADDEAVTIKRYTGPPLFLDQADAPPPASLVEKRVDSDKYPDGKLRYERQVARYSDDSYVADGFHREFYPNGEKFVEGQYVKGRQEGDWTYYHDNGKVQRTVHFTAGMPDGSWEITNADGAVIAKRGFKAGKRDGTWTIYDESGKQPLREEVYSEGKPNGTWKIWYPSGQIKTEIGIKDGVRHGAYAEWDEKGGKRAELNFVDGKLDGTATMWGTDGKKIIQEYEDGKLIKGTEE
jgi:antitoxin component YwqK of YwqJK toxin-antitoxin module